MHHYEYNIGDWRRRTSNLSYIEKGIYQEFMDTYYLDELPLTTDKSKLMRSHGIRAAEEIEAAEFILEEFFCLKDDGYHHEHCDEVLDKIYRKSRKAKISAIHKWIKRYEKEGKSEKAAAKKAELDALLCERIEKECERIEKPCEDDAKAMLPINPLTHNPDKKNKSENKFSDDDMKCAEYMFSLIQQINPQHKDPNFKSWANTIRLMRERDKKTHKEICQLFKWANNDPFWSTNILGPEKLRKKFDELTIKAKQQNSGGMSNEKQQGIIEQSEVPNYSERASEL